jgi:hypothetical protein
MKSPKSSFACLLGLLSGLGIVLPTEAGPLSEIDLDGLQNGEQSSSAFAVQGSEVDPAAFGIDPHGTYGPCGPGAGLRGKPEILLAAGKAVGATTAVAVLDCRPFDGAGGARVVPCPTVPGNPYNFCVESRNDGVGNYVLLGVIKANTVRTNPLSTYSCGDGSRVKADLVVATGKDPRDVNGIAVISCRRYDGAGGAYVVPCPTGPHPYAYCVESANDGAGNHVLLGVIPSTGPSDPFAMYGNCNGNADFRVKSSLISEVGRSLSLVNGIDIIACTGWSGGGGTAVVPCTQGTNYVYCLRNTNDGAGNSISLGVIQK